MLVCSGIFHDQLFETRRKRGGECGGNVIVVKIGRYTSDYRVTDCAVTKHIFEVHIIDLSRGHERHGTPERRAGGNLNFVNCAGIVVGSCPSQALGKLEWQARNVVDDDHSLSGRTETLEYSGDASTIIFTPRACFSENSLNVRMVREDDHIDLFVSDDRGYRHPAPF